MAMVDTVELSADSSLNRSISHRRRRRRAQAFRRVLLLAGLIAAVNAIVGDRGVLEIRRAGREYDELSASIASLRAENRRLRGEAHQLLNDPKAIEAEARRALGLMRPGEILITVHDVPRK